MSVTLSVRTMQSLLARPAEERDMQWAHEVCTASRFIHLDVWRFCAKYDYAEGTILPLLKEARSQLLALRDADILEDADRNIIDSYVKNDYDRMKNLRDNYLQGRASAFRPDDLLSEPEYDVD